MGYGQVLADCLLVSGQVSIREVELESGTLNSAVVLCTVYGALPKKVDPGSARRAHHLWRGR